MKQIIQTDRAPAAVGPYSQAVVIPCKELIFCAGQIGLDPASGQMVEGDVRAQTRRCLENAAAVLEAAGSDFAHVVKTTVFLMDMSDFGAMNDVYKEFFPDDPPARSAVAVNGLPKGALVEVEIIATR